MPIFCPAAAKDIFLFDGEELRKISDESTLALGLACHRENRVLSLDRDDSRLWATVEDDALSNFPLQVTVERSDEGRLLLACECGESERQVCRHQVAVFFAYNDLCHEQDGLMTAADTAVKDRIKRALSEVRVEAEGGQPWFGSWRASSLNAAIPRKYRVVIRDLRERGNYCSCPDFAGNQLGTCKHIEAALHKIRKHPEYETFRELPPPYPFVYLCWEHEPAPQIRLRRTPAMAEDLPRLLDTHFAADGAFKGRMPEDFFRFLDIADQRGDIHIGDDAVDWANHQARAAGHAQRAEHIREQIENSLGKLPGVKARLYPYQVSGVAFLAGTGRALLADDMGLGKTLQAIAAATWLKRNEEVRRTLIVCPASLKHQWVREIAKFTDLQSQIIGGPPAMRSVQYARPVDFFILNYELVLRDLSLITATLRPDLVIMDEAQRIKNWRTKISAAVKLIPSRFAFVLTGTPLENRLEDLYSLMQVVDPKVLGPLWRYMVDFHVTDERNKVLGYRNLSVLRRRLQPVMLRRDRKLVSDQLPERIQQQLDVAMTARQIEIHNDGIHKAGILATIAKKRPLTPSEQNRLIAALQQARMACDSAGLVDKQTEDSPKIDEMEVLLEEICRQEGRKAVVFSQWELMTQMVEKRLRRMGLGFVRLHGGVPTARRGELMDRFREDDSVQVFVSTDAGGVGLNLQSASALINLDVPWNPAILEQRNARVHRLGQTRKVQIITMVAADSYEQQVLALIGNKQDLFDNVIKEDGTEDVVGISKKLLETLVDTLAVENDRAPEPEKSAEEEDLPEEGEEVAKLVEPKPSQGSWIDEAIHHCIEVLQRQLGPRIERILGSGGGLICVLDRVDGESESLAVELSNKIPVALIDHYALCGLSRLGSASPLAEAETYFSHDQQRTPIGPSRLALIAEEKLNGARLLLEQRMARPATELLVSALMARVADRAGLASPPSASEAGVWIYGTALPQGVVTGEEAGLLMRAVALSQADNLPLDLAATLMSDAESFK